MRNVSDIDFYTHRHRPYKHNAHESAFGFSDCTELIELEIDVFVVDKEALKNLLHLYVVISCKIITILCHYDVIKFFTTKNSCEL